MKQQEVTLTAQGIFDATVLHLAAQGEKCVIPGTVMCLYRRDDNARCAVGFHLTEMEAEAAIGSVSTLVYRGRLPERLLPHVALLESLQRAHDNHTVLDWPKRLRYVAADHNLDDRVVTAAFGAP